jgi:hypothetical protein
MRTQAYISNKCIRMNKKKISERHFRDSYAHSLDVIQSDKEKI